MARVGDTIEADGVRLKVEALDGLRIARLSLFHVEPDAGKRDEGRMTKDERT
jgi:hypothetical protein